MIEIVAFVIVFIAMIILVFRTRCKSHVALIKHEYPEWSDEKVEEYHKKWHAEGFI